MSDHSRHFIERHCDVAVIGGSASGLAAALQLARQRRSVIVIDSGEPRNAPAAHMHSYLGHEGLSPSKFLAIGRDEVRSFGVEVLAGRAVQVARADDGRFCVELVGGHRVIARRLIAATGLIDELPDIAGVAEQWGVESFTARSVTASRSVISALPTSSPTPSGCIQRPCSVI